MATIYKTRARKAFASGPVTVSWANYTLPGLASKVHIVLYIGDAMVRIEADAFRAMANTGLEQLEQHKQWEK